MLRPLRYLPATAFALLALAFVGLWVRGYSIADIASGPMGTRQNALSSNRGIIQFVPRGRLCRGCRVPILTILRACEPLVEGWNQWARTVFPLNHPQLLGSYYEFTWLGFGLRSKADRVSLFLPHGFLALSSLATAALLAFKPITRFTVRGLLMTTTLLAAVLGLVVYAV